MKIHLSPQACSGHTTTVSVNGLIVTVDGVDYDLSVIPEGGQAEAEAELPFVGIVTREEFSILFQYDSDKAENHQTAPIEDWTIDITEGEVTAPVQWKPEPELVEEADV